MILVKLVFWSFWFLSGTEAGRRLRWTSARQGSPPFRSLRFRDLASVRQRPEFGKTEFDWFFTGGNRDNGDQKRFLCSLRALLFTSESSRVGDRRSKTSNPQLSTFNPQQWRQAGSAILRCHRQSAFTRRARARPPCSRLSRQVAAGQRLKTNSDADGGSVSELVCWRGRRFNQASALGPVDAGRGAHPRCPTPGHR
jgi:hypothetical protein